MRTFWLLPFALASCGSDCGHTTSYRVVQPTAFDAYEDGVYVTLEKSHVDDRGWGGIDTRVESTSLFRVTGTGLAPAARTPTAGLRWSGTSLVVTTTGVTVWTLVRDECVDGVQSLASPDRKRYALVLGCPGGTQTRIVEASVDGGLLVDQRVDRPLGARAVLANDGAVAVTDSVSVVMRPSHSWSWSPAGGAADLPVPVVTFAVGTSWLQRTDVQPGAGPVTASTLSFFLRDGTAASGAPRTVDQLAAPSRVTEQVLAWGERIYVLENATKPAVATEDEVYPWSHLVQLDATGTVLRDDPLTFLGSSPAARH